METVVPTKRELFLGFLSMGIISFGGALPLARNMVVERRRWLRPEEFVELLGLIAMPSMAVIALGAIYQHFHDDPHVRHLFAGLAAAAGLLISMTIKVALPLLTTMLVLTPVSVLLLARFGKNGGGQ